MKHWQDGDMRRRWTAAGMLVAEAQFRRIANPSGSPPKFHDDPDNLEGLRPQASGLRPEVRGQRTECPMPCGVCPAA
jgi:hypothetical protein